MIYGREAMGDTAQTHKAGRSTPAATLEEHIMDPNVPKSEAEWWAHREIIRLRAALSSLSADTRGTGDEAAFQAYVRSCMPVPLSAADVVAERERQAWYAALKHERATRPISDYTGAY